MRDKRVVPMSRWVTAGRQWVGVTSEWRKGRVGCGVVIWLRERKEREKREFK